MKLMLAAAATVAFAIPAAPALAHCKTVHHRVAARKIVHRVAYRAPIRHRAAIRTACGCGPALHRAALYREAYYAPPPPPLYRPYRPHVVTVVYERPLYRRFRPYVRPYYRPAFYGARYERFGPRHAYYRAGYRHDRFARWDGPRGDRYWR